MQSRHSFEATIGLIILTLTGCAFTGPRLPTMTDMLSQSTGQNGRACVRTSDIRGYGVLQNNVISIDSLRDYYLATVLPGCTDLYGSLGAGFSGNFSEICGQSMAKLITQDGSCTLGKLYRFENRDAAFATYNELLEQRQALQEAEAGN